MNLLAGGSILAAFFAGAVALFAPCCIVFMLPAYLASAVKGRRWRLFPLTLIFAAGLGVIILPLTLGVGLLASTLTRFHTPLYLTGGLLMLLLGGLAVAGKSWSLPWLRRSPSLDRTDAAGVFGLGVFSGVASSCCAPVLAGVLALSALAGSLPGSMALGLAYVFGMVFPLFLIALAWDRLHLGQRRLFKGRDVTLRFRARNLRTTTTNVLVGIAFSVMGAGVITLALVGNETAAPGFQVGIGRWLERLFADALQLTRGVPDLILGVALLAFAGFIGWLGIRNRPSEASGPKEPCHGTSHAQTGEEEHAHGGASQPAETARP